MPQRSYFYARTGYGTRSLPQLHGLAKHTGQEPFEGVKWDK